MLSLFTFCAYFSVIIELSTAKKYNKHKCNHQTLHEISNKINGEIFTKHTTETALYTRLSQQWNAEFNDVMPNVIIMAESSEDISTILTSYIIPCKLKFSVRSAHLGGHLWSGYSILDNGVVIDVSRLNTIKYIDNDHKNCDKLILLEPGVTQGCANQFTKPYLQIFPTSGDCDQFAFGGFLQGGGLSLFLRSAGIAADYIEKAEVVLMNGDIVTATKYNQYSDLLYGIKGGGAGNFGIITKYFMSTFEPATQVISFEVYWDLKSFKSEKKLVRFLKAWAATQNDNNYPEFTAWFVLLNDGNSYVFRMLGIWNGDIDKGYDFWNYIYLKQCKCKGDIIENRSNIMVTNAWYAVEIHQNTFGGQGQFIGVIDARTVKNEWSNKILTQMAKIMLSHLNDDKLVYTWLLVSYGGNMLLNDPNNEETSFGNRDAVGDITLFISPVNDDKKGKYLSVDRLNSLRKMFLDKISPFYYPNHPLSTEPIENVPVAFYDCCNKPQLYKKLVEIKKKYDPDNLLNNPVTINVNEQCPKHKC